LITILGSGFGLYGHLPALVELGHRVNVPARYRQAFESRPELGSYASSVHFEMKESELLASAELLILARRPADNESIAVRAAELPHPPQLVIEKPPAPSPDAALALERTLAARGIRQTTPYLFAQCDWARKCRASVANGSARNIVIDWYFNSSRAVQSWKSAPQEGGGLLGYYVIHLIAVADFILGGHRVTTWNAGSTAWKVESAALSGSASMAASFGTGSGDSVFRVTNDGILLDKMPTPFGGIPARGERDPRIEPLKAFYNSEVFSDRGDPMPSERRLRILESWKRLAEASSG
jgi:predicted dehydrogenase